MRCSWTYNMIAASCCSRELRTLERTYHMIAVYRDDHEIIVVGLNADGNPMDSDGTLFGSESGRNIDDFERFDVNTDIGQTAHIETEIGVLIR